MLEDDSSKLTPGQGKMRSMNCLVLPCNQINAWKISAGASYLLIGMCVCTACDQ